MGSVRLELFGYLVLAWVLVYLVIWKGLQNSGKVHKLAKFAGFGNILISLELNIRPIPD